MAGGDDVAGGVAVAVAAAVAVGRGGRSVAALKTTDWSRENCDTFIQTHTLFGTEA